MAPKRPDKVIHCKDTPYQKITTVESAAEKIRFMYTSTKDDKQGAISIKDPGSLCFEYTRLSFVALAFMDRAPKRVLFVGLGAGSMPSYLGRYYPDATIDVVEIDGEVLDVAQKYFYFRKGGNIRVHIEDGRSWLRKGGRPYDLIFLDAYHGGEIPYHLTTMEFLAEARGRLGANGVVASNVLGPYLNKSFDSMVATYLEIFPNLYVFEGRKTYNTILVSTASEERFLKRHITARARQIHEELGMDINLPRLASIGFYRPSPEEGTRPIRDEGIPLMR